VKFRIFFKKKEKKHIFRIFILFWNKTPFLEEKKINYKKIKQIEYKNRN